MTGTTGPLARRRSGLVRRLSVGLGVTVLLGAVAILPILPWPMGIVTDAKHTYTATVPTNNRGAYLVTRQGAMQLFTWNVEPDDFPTDAPTLAVGSIGAAVVVQKVFDEPHRYQLINLTTGSQVSWASSATDGMQLTLRPASDLPAGGYVLVVPSDGMFGGRTWHYFRLEAADEEV